MFADCLLTELSEKERGYWPQIVWFGSCCQERAWWEGYDKEATEWGRSEEASIAIYQRSKNSSCHKQWTYRQVKSCLHATMSNDAWIFVLGTSLPSAAQLLLAVWTDFYNIFAWMLQSTNFHFKKISLWKRQPDLYSCITLKRMQVYTSLNDSIKFSILVDCPPFFP